MHDATGLIEHLDADAVVSVGGLLASGSNPGWSRWIDATATDVAFAGVKLSS